MNKKRTDPPEWKVENVVATAKLVTEEERIDLNAVARKYPNCEYNPERFPGLVMRVENPKSTILIFGTGKMVITGMRSSDMVTKVTDVVVKNLREVKLKVSGVEDVKVQNIVASGNMKTPINLNEASIVMDNAMYEPEVFPGLIYRMPDPKSVFLLFSTGKIVCTGAKTEEMVREAIKKLHDLIYELEIAGISDDAEEIEELDGE